LAQWFRRRSLKCEKFTEDGRKVMAIVPMDLWSRWTKKLITNSEDHANGHQQRYSAYQYSNLIWCKSMLNMMLITTKMHMSSEKYVNSTYSLSESILRLDVINSNTYFMLHLSNIYKIWKFRIFTKKLAFIRILKL
jgi:hypothetical protein